MKLKAIDLKLEYMLENRKDDNQIESCDKKKVIKRRLT